MKSLIGLTIGALVLAGCSGATRHQATGFSGLGAEPGVTKAASLDPQYAGGTLYPDIPVGALRSGSSNQADHAELVIKRASGSSLRSKPVSVGGQPLALSVLYVNAIPYAVLKPQAGLFSPNLVPETSAAFAANARTLTGCPAASGVYKFGPQPNRPKGMMLALACSS
ncbi:MAG: hypothetical protein AB3N23_15985 [Paracoccaceae bacterium]